MRDVESHTAVVEENNGAAVASRREEGTVRPSFWRGRRDLLILLAILLIAAIFRFTGTNFDRGTLQHPDERFIITSRATNVNWPSSWDEFTDWRKSPLNLRNELRLSQGDQGDFVYGSLPVYVLRASGWVLDSILPPDPDGGRPKGYYLQNHHGVTLLGRHLSGIFDLITIVLVFLIGRRLFSSAAGLVAAALVGFAVTHIQLSHFFTADVILTTFMMAAVYFSVVLMQRPSWWAAALAGTFLGLAFASKVSILPFGLIIVAAVVLRAFYRKRTRLLGAELGDPIGMRPATKAERERSLGRHLLGGSGYVLIAAVTTFLAFAITEPYVLWMFDWSHFPSNLQAFLDSNIWWRRLQNETRIQSGVDDLPYTRQYVGTIPVLYHFENYILWGIGPIPGILTVAGFVAGMWRAIRGRPAEILLLAGALPYFGTILILESKWMRYMLPIVPIFCLLGAALLVRGIAWQARRAAERKLVPGRKGLRFLRVQRNAFRALTAITLAAAFLWAVAFMNVYTNTHPRLAASQWIRANVPEGILKNVEGWDDRVPVDGGNYRETGFDIYDYRPPEQQYEYIKGKLAEVDYVFLASNRLYGSISHLPWAYPVMNKYYELLFDEKLGFEHVHTSQVTPELFGIKFDDQRADEMFTVYDHPRVDVFKKVTQLTDEQMRSLFSPALNRPALEFEATRHGKVTDDKSLMYPERLTEQPDTGPLAWNPLAQEDTQWVAVLLWLLAAQILGLIALPIVFAVCRNLPDRGYPFAKLVGILLVTWVVWMLASVRLVPFTVWSILLGMLLVGGLSVVCWRLGAGRALREFYSKRRGLILFYEVLFFVAFAAFLWIRIQNPDLWHPWNGGEKPMEVGFLNSTLRSPWMPPADPFFAGGYINYYYHGIFIIAALIKLIGVDPAIGVNLAIPLLYALTFIAATSVVYNIVAWSQRRRGSTNLVSRSGMVFGALGAVLMIGIGNMHGFWQWLMLTFPDQARDIMQVVANPVVLLLYVLLLLAAVSIVYNLVARLQRGRERERVSWYGLGIGLLAGILAIAAVNMLAVWQWLTATIPGVIDPIDRFSRSIGFGDVSVLRVMRPDEPFDFWGPSRIIPGTINEFPFWSFLFADLHPHLINMPFTIMAVALAVNLAFARRPDRTALETLEARAPGTLQLVRVRVGHALGWLWGDGWRGVLTFAVMALTLGALAVINSWDFPVHAALTGGAVLVAALRLRSGAADDDEALRPARDTIDPSYSALSTQHSTPSSDLPAGLEAGPRWTFYGAAAGSFLLLAGMALAAYLPFFLNFKAFFTQILPLVDGAPIPGTGTLMRRTELSEFLVIWLLFIFVALTYLVISLRRYPWSAARAEVRALLGGGAQQRMEPATPLPQQASVQRVFSFRRRPSLALAAEGASGYSTHVVAFQRDEPSGALLEEDTRPEYPVEPQSSSADRPHGSNGQDGSFAHALETASLESGAVSELETPNAAQMDDRSAQVRADRSETGSALSADQASSDGSYFGSGQSIEPLPGSWVTDAHAVAATASAGTEIVTVEQPGIIPAWIGVLMLASTATLVALQIVTGQFLLALLIGLIGGIAATALGGARSAANHATSMLFVGALAIALGVEVVYLADHLRGGDMFRMNTVFKFYIQVWVLFALAAGAGAYFILYGIRERAKTRVATTAEHEAGYMEHGPENGFGATDMQSEFDDLTVDELGPPAQGNEAYSVMTTRPLTDNWLAWANTVPLAPSHLGKDGDDSSDLHEPEVTVEAGPATAASDYSSPPARQTVIEPAHEAEVETRTAPRWTLGRILWTSIFALLLAASLAYTFLGTPARIRDRTAWPAAPDPGTLNGLAFMENGIFNTSVAIHPVNLNGDYEAIQWLNRNVTGLKVIAERAVGYYREYGMRVASNTGLPMIVGGLHQDEQRYGWMVGDRHADIRRLYTTTDVQEALGLINEYDIDYIYIGQLEQSIQTEGAERYDGAKFEQLADPQVGVLRKVFTNEDRVPEGLLPTMIYEVIRETESIVGAPVADSGIPGISITPVPTRTPTPMPTPPVDDPVLKALIADVAANPADATKRDALVEWYRTNGFPADAARELEVLVRQNPQDVAKRHQLGDAYQAAGQADRALKAWEDARDVDPNNPAGHNKVGIAYLERKRYDDAINEFRASTDRAPEFAESWYQMGEAYAAKGDRDNARAAFQATIDNSREPNTWQDLARQRLNELR